MSLMESYSLQKNNETASKGQMIYFDQESDGIDLASVSSSGSYLILSGKTLNEPIARHGTFLLPTLRKESDKPYLTIKMERWDD